MSLTGDPITDDAVPAAVNLIWSIRTGEEAEIAEAFADIDAVLRRNGVVDKTGYTAASTLATVLAAMVPDDRSPSDLLQWMANPEEYQKLRHDGFRAAEAASIAAAMARGKGAA